ncbi:unnamed protein product [Parajaminaea phylloscopi]
MAASSSSSNGVTGPFSHARCANDPHAHQPFRRYYLGPSPISSSLAAKAASIIKRDAETDEPIALAIVGRDGVMMPKATLQSGGMDGLPGAAPYDMPQRPAEPSRRTLSHGALPSSSLLDVPKDKRRRLHRDPSAASAFTYSSTYSVPETSANRLGPRSSTPPPSSSPGVMRSNTFDTSNDAIPPMRQRHLSFDVSASAHIRRSGVRSEGGAGTPTQSEPSSDTGPMRAKTFDVIQTTSVADRDLAQSRPLLDPSRLRPPSVQGEDDVGERNRRLRHIPSIQSLAPSQKSSHRSLRHAFSKSKLGDTPIPDEEEVGELARRADRPSAHIQEPVPGILSRKSSNGQVMTADDRPDKGLQRDSVTEDQLIKPSPSGAHFAHLHRPQRDPSFAALHKPSQHDHQPHRFNPVGSAHIHHGREFSRQSRMSRASTAGTFASLGFASSEGSFGASGGFRARIARALRPRTFKSRETPSEKHPSARRATAAELASRVEETRRLWKGGVAPGQVGTSSGGTKWVGQSFEVGRRFWEVIDAREEKLGSPDGGVIEPDDADAKSRDESSETRTQTFEGPGTKELSRGVEEDKQQSEARDWRTEGVERSQVDSRGMNRSASAVLTTFAREANLAQDQREERQTRESLRNPPISSFSSESARPATLTPTDHLVGTHTTDDGKSTSAAKSQTATFASLPVSRAPPQLAQVPQPKGISNAYRAPASKVVDSEKVAGQRAPGSTLDYIESRQGWSDIASMMSGHSSLQSRNLAKNIVDRAEQRFKAARQSMGKTRRDSLDTNRVLATSETKSGRVLAVKRVVSDIGEEDVMDGSLEEISIPLTTPAEVFATPLEAPFAQADGPLTDYFTPMNRPQLSKSIGAKEENAASPSSQQPRSSNLPSQSSEGLNIGQPAQGISSKRENGLAHNVFFEEPETYNSISQDAASAGNSGLQGEADPVKIRCDKAKLPLPSSQNGAHTQSLKEKASASSMVIHESKPGGVFAQESKGLNEKTNRTARKTVQFERASLGRPLLAFRSMSSTSAIEERPGRRSLITKGRPGDAAPAPPAEVLSRPQSPATSRHPSPAEEKDLIFAETRSFREPGYEADEIINHRSVLRRERMLIRNDWTPSETVPQDVDEHLSRRLSVHVGQWKEYLVVLRQSRIELWAGPSMASKLSGHSERLHLALVIPLRQDATSLSMFSHVDRIFCISYPQQNAMRHHSTTSKNRVLSLRRTGTNLLLFDARLLSSAADWMWDIWREIGGLIPSELEVHIPAYDIRVRFLVPEEMPCTEVDDSVQLTRPGEGELALLSRASRGSGREGYRTLTPHRLTMLMTKMIKDVPEWEEIMEVLLQRGVSLALAWCKGHTLDWIVYDRSLSGQGRDWAALVGTMLKESRQPARLEFRVASHYPTSVSLANGQHLIEPASIEGFLWRVKPVSGVLTRLYFTTHDHHAFICKPSKAFPPDRYVAVEPSSLPQDEGTDAKANTRPRPRRHRSASAATFGDVASWHDANSLRSSRRDSMSGISGAGWGNHHMRRRSSFGGASVNRDVSRATRSRRRDETTSNLRQYVVDTTTSVATSAEDLAHQVTAFRVSEQRRQFDQVTNAEGYIDVKNIFMIRYLGDDENGAGSGTVKKPDTDSPDQVPMPIPTPQENHPEDEPDLGGEEGLNLSSDRAALRKARQFEVVMNNGRSTRLEAYSRSVAKEWVSRLHDLSVYWKRREKVDALEAMEVCGFDSAMIRRKKKHGTEDADVVDVLSGKFGKTGNNPGMGSTGLHDSDSISQNLLLGNVWNWCTILACRGIVRSGRLFVKDRPLSPFRSRYYILIGGRLLCYKLLTGTRTARGRQNAGIFHKRTGKVGSGKGSGSGGGASSAISLRDSHVWSGRLADSEVGSVGRSEAAGAMGPFASGGAADTGTSSRHRVPRMYGDGLLSVDEDEDCTFVLRYRMTRISPASDGPNLEAFLTTQNLWATHRGAANEMLRSKVNGMASASAAATQPMAKSPAAKSALGDDRQYATLTLRARSRLERDLWVHAINGERERLARSSKWERERELSTQDDGETPWCSHGR